MQNVTRPDGQPVNVTFTAGLPGPFDGPCIFLLDDGSIHAGDVLRSSKTFPAGAISTTNPAGGLHEKFEIPLCRVIGWADAGRRGRKAAMTASNVTPAIAVMADDVKLATMNVLNSCGVTVHDADPKDFLAICADHGLLEKDGKSGFYTESKLLKAYAELRVEILTYNQLLGLYRKLLEANPGKALFIGRLQYAVLDQDAYLYGIYRGQRFTEMRTFDFDRDNYNTCTGGWDSESFVETWQHIQAPVFVDLVDRTQGW